MPGGRPTKYNAQFHPKLAEAWAVQGLTDPEIAEKLDISPKTIDNWKNKHPEFLLAIKKSKEDPDDRVERALFERALGYEWKTEEAVKYKTGKDTEEVKIVEFTRRVPPDATSIIYWLKNRRPKKWRDTREYILNDSNPLNVIFKKDGDLEESNLETNVSS